jgi:uncharacterized membrane protein YeiH
MQFHLPIWFDLGATFLFAITGAWIAIRKGYDFVGVFMLALLTGVGGGMLRDVIFIANGPPVAVQDSRFLMAVALGALVGTLTFRRGPQFERLFEIVDALGLGVYAVVGAQKALAAGLHPVAALLAGVTNATGGGILRDLVVRIEPLVFRPGQFYVLAALAGCVVFVTLTVEATLAIELAAAAAIVTTFMLRLLAIQYDWQTKPVATTWGPRRRPLDDGLDPADDEWRASFLSERVEQRRGTGSPGDTATSRSA